MAATCITNRNRWQPDEVKLLMTICSGYDDKLYGALLVSTRLGRSQSACLNKYHSEIRKRKLSEKPIKEEGKYVDIILTQTILKSQQVIYIKLSPEQLKKNGDIRIRRI